MKTEKNSVNKVGSASKSSTVVKALKVLETVAEFRQPVSILEVAAATGYDKSTAYRMLTTLAEAGYVSRDEQAKRYRLSYKVVTLGRNLFAEDQVSQLVQEGLAEISRITGETVHYSVLENDRTVIISKASGVQLVSVDFHIGDSERLYCTSIGKMMLAHQSEEFIERAISEGLPKIAKNTITDPMVLRTEIEQIRKQGYAFDDCEFTDEMRCVAVPIYTQGNVVNRGFSISGPISRFTRDKLEMLMVPMVDVSLRLSRKLGASV